MKEDENAVWVTIRKHLGSIEIHHQWQRSTAIDGISLTVAQRVREERKSADPAYRKETTLLRERGQETTSLANIENDGLGKYIERFSDTQR